MALTKASPECTQAISLTKDFLNKFQTWIKQSNLPTEADLKHFLNSSFQISSNGQLLAKSIPDYIERIENLRKKYNEFKISIIDEPLYADNRVAIQYRLDLKSKDGHASQIYIMAFADVHDGKFSRWNEIAHEKGTGNWHH